MASGRSVSVDMSPVHSKLVIDQAGWYLGEAQTQYGRDLSHRIARICAQATAIVDFKCQPAIQELAGWHGDPVSCPGTG
jgi:hypothetical protein